MSNIIKANFPNFFDAGSYPPSEVIMTDVVDEQSNTSVLENQTIPALPPRNLRKDAKNLRAYHKESATPADLEKAINLAYRVLEEAPDNWHEESLGYINPHEDVVVSIAQIVVAHERAVKHVQQGSKDLAMTFEKIADGKYKPRMEQAK